MSPLPKPLLAFFCIGVLLTSCATIQQQPKIASPRTYTPEELNAKLIEDIALVEVIKREITDNPHYTQKPEATLISGEPAHNITKLPPTPPNFRSAGVSQSSTGDYYVRIQARPSVSDGLRTVVINKQGLVTGYKKGHLRPTQATTTTL